MDLFFRSLILQSFQQILKHLLTNVTNKTNLKEYLAKKFIKLHDSDKQTMCIIYNDTHLKR